MSEEASGIATDPPPAVSRISFFVWGLVLKFGHYYKVHGGNWGGGHECKPKAQQPYIMMVASNLFGKQFPYVSRPFGIFEQKATCKEPSQLLNPWARQKKGVNLRHRRKVKVFS